MAVDKRLVKGLGLGPQDSCYNPNKSWYWPNWMNDPVEQACASAQAAILVSPPPPTPPGVPDIGTQKTGTNVTPDQAKAIVDEIIARQTQDNRTQLEEFFAGLAERLTGTQPPAAPEPCSWYQTEAANGACVVGGAGFWGLLIGVGVITAVVVAKR